MDFKLVQKAKSKGGDRYECVTDPTFTIYIPQNLSRNTNNIPHEKIQLNITPIVT